MRILESKGLRVDVDTLDFTKSSKSGPISDNCVEWAHFAGGTALRDSTNPGGAVHLFTDAEWSAFTGAVRIGEADKIG